jgi:hypothetical protein
MPAKSTPTKTVKANNLAPKKSILKRPTKDTLTLLFEQVSLNEKTDEQIFEETRTFYQEVASKMREDIMKKYAHVTFSCDTKPLIDPSEMKAMLPTL